MGREIRRVPANWKHPKNDDGSFRPLYDQDYEAACAEWWADAVEWRMGDTGDLDDFDREMRAKYNWYWDYNGGPPLADDGDHRPAWTEEDATNLQMYETVSEGTPVSPVFATLVEMENWLAEDGYWDAFDGRPNGPQYASTTRPTSRQNPGYHLERVSRDAARAFCETGWAPSMLVVQSAGKRTIHKNAEALVAPGSRRNP